MRAEASPEEVASILNQYKTIIQSNTTTGELVFEDTPVIIARAEFMSNIYSELESLVGASASSVLKRIGKAYGELFYELLKSEQGDIIADKAKIYNYICAETQAIGWGKISIEVFPEKIIIISEEGFVSSRTYKGTSQQSVDGFFLGYFEGLLSKLNNTRYYGVGIKCMAMGDDCCKLEFGTEPVF